MSSSHRATTLFALREVDPQHVIAIFALSCGCVVRREVKRDRLVEFEGERPVLGGKYSCPRNHPVRYRRAEQCPECGPIRASTCVICGGANTTCEHLACVLCG